MIQIDSRPPLIVTERLALRELRLTDAAAVAAHVGDQRVARYLLAVPNPYPVALATRWITGRINWWPQRRGVTLAIVRREAPDALVGSASLRWFPKSRRAELGYWLGVASWGLGFATEAAGALVDYGFGELELERVYAQVLEGNAASCRVLEKLGMLEEGVRRRHVRKHGRLRDVALYGLLYDEWRARRD